MDSNLVSLTLAVTISLIAHWEVRLFRISSILVHFLSPLTFFAAVRAGVRFLSDPVTAREFIFIGLGDPVMEAVSCVMSVVVSFRCSCINAREASEL